ncbi:hypothetical protein DMO24_01565 [Modestobacter versicolor]|uniref:Uncharacterized protein n=1 Tax=Modestobacter versicolor TaxID=429133 RepID=A0A323VEB9_9ACTN|nr:hypothetical protein DMO24_01565 [Modestobacter versicolor]
MRDAEEDAVSLDRVLGGLQVETHEVRHGEVHDCRDVRRGRRRALQRGRSGLACRGRGRRGGRRRLGDGDRGRGGRSGRTRLGLRCLVVAARGRAHPEGDDDGCGHPRPPALGLRRARERLLRLRGPGLTDRRHTHRSRERLGLRSLRCLPEALRRLSGRGIRLPLRRRAVTGRPRRRPEWWLAHDFSPWTRTVSGRCGCVLDGPANEPPDRDTSGDATAVETGRWRFGGAQQSRQPREPQSSTPPASAERPIGVAATWSTRPPLER